MDTDDKVGCVFPVVISSEFCVVKYLDHDQASAERRDLVPERCRSWNEHDQKSYLERNDPEQGTTRFQEDQISDQISEEIKIRVWAAT